MTGIVLKTDVVLVPAEKTTLCLKALLRLAIPSGLSKFTLRCYVGAGVHVFTHVLIMLVFCSI